jgi:hypothetical protein
VSGHLKSGRHLSAPTFRSSLMFLIPAKSGVFVGRRRGLRLTSSMGLLPSGDHWPAYQVIPAIVAINYHVLHRMPLSGLSFVIWQRVVAVTC